MSETVNLPALGESVTEGTVTRWLKAVGDEVAVDEPLVEVSTDKVRSEERGPGRGRHGPGRPPAAQRTRRPDHPVPVRRAHLATPGGRPRRPPLMRSIGTMSETVNLPALGESVTEG
ncbi:biotin/lipoyl-containing protein, partial [Micrococcus sp. HSID17227]|uniref:biotin/lipoyl-containing protein n=1 Tax=Micrococcus sp. HSID17227 TaxID=2419506 RepID=UPI00272D1A6B